MPLSHNDHTHTHTHIHTYTYTYTHTEEVKAELKKFTAAAKYVRLYNVVLLVHNVV